MPDNKTPNSLVAIKVWYPRTKVAIFTKEEWATIKDDEVQVVNFYFDDGTRLTSNGHDYYALNILTGEYFEGHESIEPVLGKGHIKTGSSISITKLKKIEDEAFADWGAGWLYTSTIRTSKDLKPVKDYGGKDKKGVTS